MRGIFGKTRWLWRLPVLLVIALALPFATPHLPLAGPLERTVHDAYRYLLAERTGPDPDIALALYNDKVARETQRTSPVDRALLADALRGIAAAGPRAIGLDMAFVQATEDQAELVAALRDLKVPTYVIYADPEADHATYWSSAIDAFARADQDAFWAELAGSNVRRASPAIGAGPDRVARAWPRRSGRRADGEQSRAALLAHGLADTPEAARDYSGAIRYRMLSPQAAAVVDGDADAGRARFPTFPLDVFSDPVFAGIFGEQLSGRIVLVGADTFGADKISTPITRIGDFARSPGVVVHAHMLRQALDRDFPPPLGLGGTLLLALIAVAGGASSALIERRAVLLAAALIGGIALLAALPLALEAVGVDYLGAPVIGLALAWALAFFAVTSVLRDRSAEQRAFAQGALGRYVPAGVASEILEDPSRLELRGEERELTLMFTDLEGFTRFCHGRDARQTAEILNAYLDAMSEVVLAHGGTLDKYVGDAIVAFWGAPIARADDTSRAVACALALQEEADRIAQRTREIHGEAFGRTRIGLHRGVVSVGNFGGAKRLQYTAMGDAMNIAARLEAANKQLGSDILVSETVREAAPGFVYRALGRVAVSGTSTGLALFEPLPEARRDLAELSNEIIAGLAAGDAAAWKRWRELVAAAPQDRAIAAMDDRIDDIARGEVHELRNK